MLFYLLKPQLPHIFFSAPSVYPPYKVFSPKSNLFAGSQTLRTWRGRKNQQDTQWNPVEKKGNWHLTELKHDIPAQSF